MASDDEDEQAEGFSQGQPLLEDVLAEFPDATEVCPNIMPQVSLPYLCSHRKSIWLAQGWLLVLIWASRALENI
jgi:hypothetical protein